MRDDGTPGQRCHGSKEVGYGQARLVLTSVMERVVKFENTSDFYIVVFHE